MTRFDGMTVGERLATAKLSKEYEQAARAQDSVALARILESVGLEDEAVKQSIDWAFNSPFSPYNQHPIKLSPELSRDVRIKRLGMRGQRIAQHFFDERGGLGSKSCVRQGCTQTALKGIDYCAYCAQDLDQSLQ